MGSETAADEMTDGMTGNEEANGMTDETCDMDDLMAELSEDELAELAELEELEELVEIALLEELEALEELDGAEEAWLDGGEEDDDEGTLQEGIPISDWLADGLDGQQGETDRTEEADEIEDPYDQIVDGYIYLITNLVNGKQYVGQTTKTIEERWRQHVYAASNRASAQYIPIVDLAIRKYGVGNFSCEEIEHLPRVSRKDLDLRECYWITYYKTCIRDYGKDCGYNYSRGGHSSRNRFNQKEEQEIVREICELHLSRREVAQKHHASVRAISTILEKNGISKLTPEEQAQLFRMRFGNDIQRLDDNNNVLDVFPSSYEAAKWTKNNVPDASERAVTGIATMLRVAAYGHTKQYGYYWCIPSLTEKECEQRMLNWEEKCQSHKHSSSASPKNFCIVCHRPISRKATYCREHYQKKLREERQLKRQQVDNGSIVPTLNGTPLTQDELEDLLRVASLAEIGRRYGVSGNAVKKFAKTQYDMVIQRKGRFHIWNETLQSYEYVEKLPITWKKLEATVIRNGSIQSLASVFRVTPDTLKTYLYSQFGKDRVQKLISQAHRHIPVCDVTTQQEFPNTYQLAKYLLSDVEHITVTEGKVSVLSRKITRHLKSSPDGTCIIDGHLISIIDD